jgi:hypothetical protein
VPPECAEVRQFLSIEDYFDFNLTSAELVPWSVRTAKVTAEESAALVRDIVSE